MAGFNSQTTVNSQDFGRDVFTNLNQLKKINNIGDKDQHAAFKEMAQQFEGLFLQLMLKTMRDANSVFASEQSSEMDYHQSMFDNQLALNLSGDRGIGIADTFYQNMIAQYSDVNASKGLERSPRMIAQTPFDIPLSNRQLVSSVKPTSPMQSFSADSPHDFVEKVFPHAQRVAKRLGIEPEVLVAQSALETGWGKHLVEDKYGRSSNNLFNIKADSRWSGDKVNVQTVEYKDGLAYKENANFRRYPSIKDSFTDYAQFVLTEPRYRDLHSSNSQDYIRGLQHSGYATDPLYADKIIDLLDHDAISNHRRSPDE